VPEKIFTVGFIITVECAAKINLTSVVRNMIFYYV
jgi:hypothetical protein